MKLLNGFHCFQGQPTNTAVGDAYFVPFAHFIYYPYFGAFMDYEQIHTVLVGWAFNGNGWGKNDGLFQVFLQRKFLWGKYKSKYG